MWKKPTKRYLPVDIFFRTCVSSLINCLSALDLGIQYVAVTKKACRQIRVLMEEELITLELLALRDTRKGI